MSRIIADRQTDGKESGRLNLRGRKEREQSRPVRRIKIARKLWRRSRKELCPPDRKDHRPERQAGWTGPAFPYRRPETARSILIPWWHSPPEAPLPLRSIA